MNKKRIYLYVIGAILLIFSIYSCTKDDEEDEVVIKPFTVSDIDGNVYNVDTIGTQIWMKENLKVTKDNTGLTITSYAPGENIANIKEYGCLYTWSVAQKVCPTGWHLPSLPEVEQLITYLGGNTLAGGKLKEIGTSHWMHPNTGATNESGFTGLAAGYRNFDSLYKAFIKEGYFWTSTTFSASRSMCLALIFDSGNSFTGNNPNEDGFSVRCLKD